jgi:archaeosine-15-forming tRNA-guanine transglycosylase
LGHDPDLEGRVSAKCTAVFRKDHAQSKNLERDGDLTSTHRAPDGYFGFSFSAAELMQ